MPNLSSASAALFASSSSPFASRHAFDSTLYPPPIHNTHVESLPAILPAAFDHHAPGSLLMLSIVLAAPFIPTFMNGPHATSR